MPMQFGIVSDRIGDIDKVVEAEAMGYAFCWAFDTPMLRSNPFVLLGLAAARTRTIRLGVGVAVPGLREAPEMANAIATVNCLAPGRTFLGLGTGNTAMRTLGRRPMRLKAFASYIGTVRALLAGDATPYQSDDGVHEIRLQSPGPGYINIDALVPVHVGGFGPRAQALAGALGDGLITGFPRGGTIASALANVRRGAEGAQRSLDGFETSAMVNVLMLEPGETLASERVVAECGSAVMANIHYLVDLMRETGAEPPDYVLPIWQEYLDFHATRNAVSAHRKLHESHYSYLDPDEARFVTPEIIRAFCIAGHAEEVIAQIKALEAQGLDALTFVVPQDHGHRQYEQFARRIMEHY
ncbi:MAG: 5,10-methylenetetrahydromethanopterin reductase [Gammaproteobacteria bacterium]|jgi:5,10-methylenetetrahydromethanopterin reductase